ncbi:hypothetical protein PV375_09670 [Gulosibacter sp. GYB002]|uniref:hypothetical protein n=1 Tax=Gulosibacter sp. GYB002 TaxID=2994391 RepID=UPI002F9663B5
MVAVYLSAVFVCTALVAAAGRGSLRRIPRSPHPASPRRISPRRISPFAVRRSPFAVRRSRFAVRRAALAARRRSPLARRIPFRALHPSATHLAVFCVGSR